MLLGYLIADGSFYLADATGPLILIGAVISVSFWSDYVEILEEVLGLVPVQGAREAVIQSDLVCPDKELLGLNDSIIGVRHDCNGKI